MTTMTMTTAMAEMTGMSPFLVPLTTATLIVTACTTVLVRRDRRRAHAYRGGLLPEDD
jgi:H+/Cl- antiporter ClcA